MKRKIALGLLFAFFILSVTSTQAQYLWNSDSAYKAGAANSGRIWGYVFGDFYYKSHSDSLNRGGNNQYTGIPQNRNAFQFRRLYLGYDYNLNAKFSTELLLAAEDNFPAYNPPSATAANNVASGDLTSNGKETFFIKLANVRWKQIFKGTDLVVGLQTTPAFPGITEKIWNYRSIERTIADIRRTPSYDFGVGLNGSYADGNFGYDLLVANGSSDKPAATSFKWFYGDLWAKFLDKKLVIDVYQDYQRLNWQPGWHHDRAMTKGYIAYNTPALTVGVEGYINNIRQDTKGALIAGGSDTISTAAQGISFYVHGDIIKNKLRFFARYDTYNPNHNVDNGKYSGYSALSSPNGYNTVGFKITGYSSSGAPTGVTATTDPTSKEAFITAGLDFTPIKSFHLMPNIWYNHYSSQLSGVKNGDYDMVYRMTFYFIFGK